LTISAEGQERARRSRLPARAERVQFIRWVGDRFNNEGLASRTFLRWSRPHRPLRGCLLLRQVLLYASFVLRKGIRVSRSGLLYEVQFRAGQLQLSSRRYPRAR